MTSCMSSKRSNQLSYTSAQRVYYSTLQPKKQALFGNFSKKFVGPSTRVIFAVFSS